MNLAIKQAIELLSSELENWEQSNCTLDYKNGIVQVWTSNTPYIDCSIYKPKINIGLIDGIKLQLAVNKWHKNKSLGA